MEKYKKWRLAGIILIPIGVALLLIFGIPFFLGMLDILRNDIVNRIAQVGIFGAIEIGLAALITGACLLGLANKHLKSNSSKKK